MRTAARFSSHPFDVCKYFRVIGIPLLAHFLLILKRGEINENLCSFSIDPFDVCKYFRVIGMPLLAHFLLILKRDTINENHFWFQ